MAPELLNTAKTPLVSIGLPVFNGESYLGAAIASSDTAATRVAVSRNRSSSTAYSSMA